MLLNCAETLHVHLRNAVTSQLLFGLLWKVPITHKLMLFCYTGTRACAQTGLCCLEYARSHPTWCKTDLMLLDFTQNYTDIRRWHKGPGQKSYVHHYKVLFFQGFISPSLGQRTKRASYLFPSEDDGSALSFCSTTFGEVFMRFEQRS